LVKLLEFKIILFVHNSATHFMFSNENRV